MYWIQLVSFCSCVKLPEDNHSMSQCNSIWVCICLQKGYWLTRKESQFIHVWSRLMIQPEILDWQYVACIPSTSVHFLVIFPIWFPMSSFFFHHPPNQIPAKWWTIPHCIAYFQLGNPMVLGYTATPKQSNPNSSGTKNICVSENGMSPSHDYFTNFSSEIIIE